MAPSVLPGDRVLVIKRSWLKPGEVVAVRDPRHPARVLVKRVSWVDSDGRTFEARGDASESSTDSRTFGPCHPVGRRSPRHRCGAVGLVGHAPERAGRFDPFGKARR
jgi:hypothetical protein